MSTKPYNKKRGAPDGGAQEAFHKSKFSKSGPKSKPNGEFKRSFDGKPKSFNKGKAPTREPKEELKKRKQPITQGGGEVEVEDEDEDVDMSDEAGEGDEAMKNGEQAPPEKRPRLTKEEKAALHAAQPHRTTLLPSYALLQELLPLWERARRADLPKGERKEAVDELWAAVKGRVGEISKGHKGGRVLQTIVKYGGKEERLGVAMELRPQWREMMESKYSKFLMVKLIRYCPTIRPLLIQDLSPHLANMLFHSYALGPLSDLHDLYANAAERKALLRGLYPKEVKIFNGDKGSTTSLAESLEAMGDAKARERVLEGVEKVVTNVFNNEQKTALSQSIFHRLVFEYLTCLYRFLGQEAADSKMREFLTTSHESLPEIVHTKDGAAVIRELLVRGNAKDRKVILQPLRKHVPAIAKDADAQLALFTAFDLVDDTKMMGKAFVSDLTALTGELASDKNGRRSLLYLLTPTSTKHYLPASIASLASSAQLARDIGTSKKAVEVRRREILEYASPPLLVAIAESAEAMVRDPGAGLVVQEVMLHSTSDKSAAINSLVTPLSTPYPDEPSSDAPDTATAHILDLPHSVRTYKTLLSGGHFNPSTKSVEVLDSALSRQFAAAVWGAITSEEAGGAENAVRLAKGNGTFIIVELIAALAAEERAAVKQVLATPKALREIEEADSKGSKLLLETLRAL